MRDLFVVGAAPFAGPADYFGSWCHEPVRFGAVLEALRRGEFARRAEAPAPQSRSGVQLVGGRAGKSVAVVPVRGLLMKSAPYYYGTSTVQARNDIRAAVNDPNVSAILLDVDSPGGTTAGTADLAAEVKNARRQKPVWAQVSDLCASAAYWVASQADQIFANDRTALVGSIGTFLTVYDYSAAAEADGVKVHHFATGPLKGAGTAGTAVTDEQRAYFQQIVDDGQAAFDAAVRAGRGLSAAELAAVRTGGVFGAAEAQRLKLIDGIRSMDRTLEALANAK